MEVALLEKLQKALQYEGLTPFSSRVAIEFLKKQLNAEDSQKVLARVIGYAVNLLNSSSNNCHPHPLQSGCPNVIPCLRSFPFWQRSFEFHDTQLSVAADIPNQALVSVIQILEDNFCIIKEEFFNLRNWHNTATNSSTGFQHYRSPMQHPQPIIDVNNGSQLHDSDIASSCA
eukprot:gene3316-4521_t